MQLEVNIRIPSLYRIIYRYVNRNENPVRGDVTLTPNSPNDNIQMGEILFLQTLEPKFATVTSGAVSSFVLNPGRWTISTKVPNIAFLVSEFDWELIVSYWSRTELVWKYLLTFSRHIAHCEMTGNFSIPATSATGGWQAWLHSWMHRTPVCGTNTKNSTLGLLIVKWIYLLLVFSWRFQPPGGVLLRSTRQEWDWWWCLQT